MPPRRRRETPWGAPDPSAEGGGLWAGSSSHPHDAQRSMRLCDFAPVLGVEGCVFHCLQLGAPRQQLMEAPFAGIVDHAPRLADFADAAAVLARVDLAIVADTAVAHLAGAMGQPARVLVCWRWLTGRADTPEAHRPRALKDGRAIADNGLDIDEPHAGFLSRAVG